MQLAMNRLGSRKQRPLQGRRCCRLAGGRAAAEGGDDVEARARQEVGDVHRAPRLGEDVSNLTAPGVCKPAEMSGKVLMSFLENKQLIKDCPALAA